MSRLAFLRTRRLRYFGGAALVVVTALLLFLAPWSSHDSLAGFVLPEAHLVLHVPDSDRLYRRLGEHPVARHVLDHPRRDALVRDVLSLSAATLRALADLDPDRDGDPATTPDPREFAGELLVSARLAPEPPPRPPRAGREELPPFPMESLLVALRPHSWSLPMSLRLALRGPICRRVVLPALPPNWGASFDDGILSLADPSAVFGPGSFASNHPPSGLHVSVSRDVVLLATCRADLVALRDRAGSTGDGLRPDADADVSCRLGPGLTRWRETLARSALGEDVATYGHALTRPSPDRAWDIRLHLDEPLRLTIRGGGRLPDGRAPALPEGGACLARAALPGSPSLVLAAVLDGWCGRDPAELLEEPPPSTAGRTPGAWLPAERRAALTEALESSAAGGSSLQLLARPAGSGEARWQDTPVFLWTVPLRDPAPVRRAVVAAGLTTAEPGAAWSPLSLPELETVDRAFTRPAMSVTDDTLRLTNFLPAVRDVGHATSRAEGGRDLRAHIDGARLHAHLAAARTSFIRRETVPNLEHRRRVAEQLAKDVRRALPRAEDDEVAELVAPRLAEWVERYAREQRTPTELRVDTLLAILDGAIRSVDVAARNDGDGIVIEVEVR